MTFIRTLHLNFKKKVVNELLKMFLIFGWICVSWYFKAMMKHTHMNETSTAALKHLTETGRENNCQASLFQVLKMFHIFTYIYRKRQNIYGHNEWQFEAWIYHVISFGFGKKNQTSAQNTKQCQQPIRINRVKSTNIVQTTTSKKSFWYHLIIM